MHITFYPSATPETTAGIYQPAIVVSAAGWSAVLGTNQWLYTTVRSGTQTFVTVSGSVQINADAAEPSGVTISLPVAPSGNWNDKAQLVGVFAPEGGTASGFSAGAVTASVGALTASAPIVATAPAGINVNYTFTYRVT